MAESPKFSRHKKLGSRNTMGTSDFRPEVEIWPFRACAMHPAVIIVTVRSLWTRLWGRYHVAQNAFLVIHYFQYSTPKPSPIVFLHCGLLNRYNSAYFSSWLSLSPWHK